MSKLNLIPTIDDLVRMGIIPSFVDDATANTAAGTPVAGMRYHNTTLQKIKYFDGVTWLVEGDHNNLINVVGSGINHLSNDRHAATAGIPGHVPDGSNPFAPKTYVDAQIGRRVHFGEVTFETTGSPITIRWNLTVGTVTRVSGGNLVSHSYQILPGSTLGSVAQNPVLILWPIKPAIQTVGCGFFLQTTTTYILSGSIIPNIDVFIDHQACGRYERAGWMMFGVPAS